MQIQNKPARTCSVAERNAKGIKFPYHWRKKFWRAVAQLVRHTTAELAIERLGQVYGVNQPGVLSGLVNESDVMKIWQRESW